MLYDKKSREIKMQFYIIFIKIKNRLRKEMDVKEKLFDK